MCGHDVCGHIICRMLHRSKFIDIMSVGQHHDPARMLARASAHSGTALADPLDLTFPLPLVLLLIIPAHISVGRLVRQRADGPGLEGIAFPEQHLRILVGLGLVVPGEIQVDIRLLIPLETQERLERNVISVFDKLCPAVRADLIRHIEAAASGIGLHLLRLKLAVMAVFAVIVRA